MKNMIIYSLTTLAFIFAPLLSIDTAYLLAMWLFYSFVCVAFTY